MPVKRLIFFFLRRIKLLFSSNIRLDHHNNIYYQVNTDIGFNLSTKGRFEESEILFFSNFIRKIDNPIILDIGANIGIHSVRWALVKSDVFIYAFEPSLKTRKILIRNLKRNKISNRVKVLSHAVANNIGKAQFYDTEDNAYSSLKDTQRKKVSSTYDVSVTTIDEHVFNKFKLEKVDLIKIDVEGFEHDVLLGGHITLSKMKPDLFVEIYEGKNSNINPERTIDFILGLGYKAFLIKGGNIEPFFGRHSDNFYNYYFTCKDSIIR